MVGTYHYANGPPFSHSPLQEKSENNANHVGYGICVKHLLQNSQNGWHVTVYRSAFEKAV